MTQASAGRSLLVAPWAASMPPESVPQGTRCMCFEHVLRRLPSCAPTEPHPDTLTCCEPVQAVSDALPFYEFIAYLFAPSHMCVPISSERRYDACGVLPHAGAGAFLQLTWPTSSCRRSGGQTTSPSSARSISELPVRPAWCAAWGRPSTAAGGARGSRSTAYRGALDAPCAGDADRPADRPMRRPW